MAIRFADIHWPNAPHYRIANARVPACLLDDGMAADAAVDAEGVVSVDLLIDRSKLARIVPSIAAGDLADVPTVDVGGRQIWPTLIDIHTHLDKGHTVARSPNLDGTHMSARLACATDRPNWTAADLRRRMDFGLRCAYAHGVTAIRTHIDTYPDNAERSWRCCARSARNGAAGSTCRPWRCVRSTCSRTPTATGWRRWSPSRAVCSAA